MPALKSDVRRHGSVTHNFINARQISLYAGQLSFNAGTHTLTSDSVDILRELREVRSRQ